MIHLPIFASRAVKAVNAHSPELLTAFGIVGVATTAYLTGKATAQAVRIIDEDESRGGIAGDPRERLKERTKLVWRLYIPAGASGAATVACIVGLRHVQDRRIAATATLAAVAERGFAEYREQVIEQIGKGPESKIRDRIAQERVDKSSSEVIYVGSGNSLCCELFTGRYFNSDMETLKQAVNDINHRVNHERWVTLSEFYDVIGVPHTSVSSNIGWDSAKLMDIQITTVLSPKGEPCLAFDYNYTKPL